MVEENPDVVSIAEHWCNIENIGMMSIPGYIQPASFCRPTRKHGGTMIFVKNDLQVKTLDISAFSEEMQCEVCGIKLLIHGLRVGVISVYRRPSGDIVNFLDKLAFILQYSSKIVDRIILCGDFNVDLLITNCSNRKLLLDLFDCFGLRVTNHEPTRVFTNINGHTSSTLVDYIVTDINLSCCRSYLAKTTLSDHGTPVLEYHFDDSTKDTVRHTSETKYVRTISANTLNRFVSALSTIRFRVICEDSDINTAFHEFIYVLRSLIDQKFPLKKVKVPDDSTAWITTEVRVASSNLKNIYWLHACLKSPQTLNLYKKTKKNYNNLLKQTKRLYHESLLGASQNKAKTVWDIVRKETGKHSKSDNKISLNIGGTQCSESFKVANAFAEHFSTIVALGLQNCYGTVVSQLCTTVPMLNHTFYFHPVHENEVINTINNLKNKKSVGTDYISSKILKASAEYIAEHLADLINLSVSSGIFPSVLKTSIVIPVLKKNDPSDIANYRPISILSVMSKVIERIVFTRIINFTDKFNIIPDCQHGFRSGRSTETAALSFVEFVYECLDKGLMVAGIFFDLSNAFDVLSFKFMIFKYYNLGFRGVFLDWLHSYFTDRLMKVRVQDAWSCEYNITSGVPQGSVLGPLLFVLFLTDLPSNISGNKLILFADDTSVAVAAECFEELTSNCGNLVQEFSVWCQRNSLIVNVGKTNCIYFGISNLNRDQLIISCPRAVITSQDCIKFLGVHIDKCLNWCQHIDTLCKKLNSAYYAINRVKDSFPAKSLLNIYYSLAYSHIAYNILLWGTSTDAGRILIAQKRILRLIFNLDPRSSCKPLFVHNDVLTTPCIYIYKCLMYIKNNQANLSTLPSYHNYNTRNIYTLSLPRHRTSKFENSPTYMGMKLFNHLPNCIKIMNKVKFRKYVRKFLLRKCYYSVSEYLGDNLTT